MARQTVTLQAVTEVAEALLAQGTEPSTVTVQARTGGSFTTVQKLLGAWRQQRDVATAAPVPSEVQTRAADLARIVWAAAAREAQVEVGRARAQASAMSAQLSEALAEITRLEKQAEALQAAAATLRSELEAARQVEALRSGECAALRSQVSALMALVQPKPATDES